MASKEALEGEEVGGPLLKEKREGGGKEPLEMEGGEVGGVLEVEEWEEVDSEECRGVVEGFHCQQTFLTLSQKFR